MSNYTPTTDFGAKDSLLTGDPDKLIVGAEFDTEFDAINVAVATKFDTAGTGLTNSSTTVNIDISALTNMAIAATAATDSVLVNDGGTMKQMDIQDMGVRVVESAAIQTFALDDANTMQVLTGATPRIWTIPTNASVAFGIGTIILLGVRDTASIELDPASGPTLTSQLASSTSTTQTVQAGGTAVLVKVATDEWMLSGDIAL